MDLKISEYKEIMNYYKLKTNLHSEYVQDLSTMFLRIDKNNYSHKKIKFAKNKEELIKLIKECFNKEIIKLKLINK